MSDEPWKLFAYTGREKTDSLSLLLWTPVFYLPECTPKKCGRVVMDGIVSRNEVAELLK